MEDVVTGVSCVFFGLAIVLLTLMYTNQEDEERPDRQVVVDVRPSGPVIDLPTEHTMGYLPVEHRTTGEILFEGMREVEAIDAE